jgi:hypothetical protein
MRPCTVSEINERLDRVPCVLDRLSCGLLDMSPRRTRDLPVMSPRCSRTLPGMARTWSRERRGHDYFTYRVQFLHRSARDYVVNTREAQMRARVPDFDVYSGIFRLLLAGQICAIHKGGYGTGKWEERRSFKNGS